MLLLSALLEFACCGQPDWSLDTAGSLEQAASLGVAVVIGNSLDLGNLVVGLLELSYFPLVCVFDSFAGGLLARDSFDS